MKSTKLEVTSKMNETGISCVVKTRGSDVSEGCYLVLRDLIFQLRRLGADGFGVDEVFLCGGEPLAQRLECLVELLSHH